MATKCAFTASLPLLLLCVASLQVGVTGDGEPYNTFGNCTYSSDCNDTMYCKTLRNDGTLGDCDSGAQCFCMETETCTRTETCYAGQRCAKFVPGADASAAASVTTAYCMPCTGGPPGVAAPVSVDEYNSCARGGAGFTPTPTPVAGSPPPLQPVYGAVYAPCHRSSDCDGAMYCLSLRNDGIITDSCPGHRTSCFCGSVSTCSTSRQCSISTRCARPVPGADPADVTNSRAAYCTTCDGAPLGFPPPLSVDSLHSCPAGSAGAVGSNSNSNSNDSDVCVDAALLQHLPPSRLVFPAHRTARVLCDASGSCATPGHVAVYHGRALTMREYCARSDVRCEVREARVNSVRYARAVRVASRTEGLEFTAFASRFGSWAEAVLLRAAVHVGL